MIKELYDEIKDNNKKIDEYDERVMLSNANRFDNKVIDTFLFSIFPYFGGIVSLLILAKNGIITSIPSEILSFTVVGTSLGVGAIGNKILDWKFKIKEKLKTFTNASSDYELLKEEIKNTLESEKLRNRNRVIEIIKDFIDMAPTRYNVEDGAISQNKENVEKRIEKLSRDLEEKYNELDVLTTQEVLHEKFLKLRCGQNSLNTISKGMIGGLLAMSYVALPFITLNIVSTYSTSLLTILSPFIIGIVGSSGYIIKKIKDSRIVFNELNAELGEYALSDKIKDSSKERLDIDKKINDKIKEICIIRLQLKEENSSMESFNDSNEQVKKIGQQNLKEYSIEGKKEDNILKDNQDDLMSFMETDIFNNEEDISYEDKGPTLVKRKSSN